MILNCNGLKGTDHITTFQALLDLHDPDFVLGTESKLCPDISSYSVFPHNYTVFRKDRNRFGTRVKPPHKAYLYNKANLPGLRKFMSESSSTFFASKPEERSVEENWNMFKTSLTTGMVQFIPHKTSRLKYKLPWINVNIKRDIKLCVKKINCIKEPFSPKINSTGKFSSDIEIWSLSWLKNLTMLT